MAEAPNGLASLARARDSRARRTMPPPRHPVPVPEMQSAGSAPTSPVSTNGNPVGLPMSSTAAPIPGPTAEQDAVTRPARSTEAAGTDQRHTERSNAALGERSGPSRPVTLYLDDSQIEFLEQAHIAGLVGTPRLDLSKSAVVRLALRRLQAEMSINEITDVLRAQPTDPNKTGRKRR